MALILALVAIAGVAAVGWAWYGMRGEQSRVAELEGRVAGLEGRLASLQNSAARAREVQSLAARLKSFRQAQSVQSEAFRQALQLLGTRIDAAGIAYREDEAAALMRIAQARLSLAADPEGAQKALEIADRTLAALDDPGLTPVRAALGREIAALEAVPKPDLTGAFAQLSAVADGVDGLPLAGGRLAPLPATASHVSAWSWQGIGTAFRRAFAPLIVVRHGARARPLLPPGEAYFVRQNVMLALETAKLALLERNARVFRSSLDEATRWIKDWFDTSKPNVKSRLATLAALKPLELAPVLPKIGAALAALQAARTSPGTPSQ